MTLKRGLPYAGTVISSFNGPPAGSAAFVFRANTGVRPTLEPSALAECRHAGCVTPAGESSSPLGSSRLENLLWALKTELEAGDSLGQVHADSLGVALVRHLLGHYAQCGPPRSGTGLSGNDLQRVIDYIEDNLSHDLSLAELARVAHLSPSHFKALFKRSVGIPVHRYVVRTRVQRAMNLLCHAGARLPEVALETGFANQSHMARCMRRVIGTSPSALKRNAAARGATPEHSFRTCRRWLPDDAGACSRFVRENDRT